MSTEYQVVSYRDRGGDTQTWVGLVADWAEHAKEYGVEPEDVDEHWAFQGKPICASPLWE